MNPDFEYLNIDEAMGIPDPDRIEMLIDYIIREIDKRTHSYIYMNSPMSGFSVPDNEIVDMFFLKDDLHICQWLGEDTMIKFTCGLKSERSYANAIFKPILDKTDVYQTVDGERILRNSEIDINFSFGRDFSFADKEGWSDRLDNLKAIIRHELEHAYGELMKPENVKVTYEDDVADNLFVPSNFIRGYNVVASRLSNSEYSTDEEKNFLVAMYIINYLEINANITNLYQRMINDFDRFGKIGSVEKYIESVNYNRSMTFMMAFDNEELFNEYKEIVQFIYGKSVRTINKLRHAMKRKVDKFFKKANKLHRNLSNIINERSDNMDVRVHDAKESYYKYKMKAMRINEDSLSDEERCFVVEFSKHLNHESDDYLILLDCWFGHI